MDNRNPQNPGQVWITFAVNGQSFLATIQMADNPLDPGTPPTKENLFDDETQALFPAGTETVNDALRVLIQPTPIYRGGTGGDTAHTGLGNLIDGCPIISENDVVLSDSLCLYDQNEHVAKKLGFISLINGLRRLSYGAYIYSGSYVGTGTYGQNSPCSLTFPFTPKLVIIADPFDWYDPLVMLPVDGGTAEAAWFGEPSSYSISCTLNNKALSWYCVNSHPVIGSTEPATASGQKNASGFTYRYIAIG